MEDTLQLYHVSETAGIKLFEPRPSPSYFACISGDVVFAISGQLLHNYLLPRDCPRVTFYAGEQTTDADIEKFIGISPATHIILVENNWYQCIREAVLYRYKFPIDDFELIDACAGYYINYKPVKPIAEQQITDVMSELLIRNVEMRFTPSLQGIAEEVRQSTLNFSLIRMRNAGV